MFYRIVLRFQINRNIFVPSGLGRVKTLPYKNPLQQPDKLQFEKPQNSKKTAALSGGGRCFLQFLMDYSRLEKCLMVRTIWLV